MTFNEESKSFASTSYLYLRFQNINDSSITSQINIPVHHVHSLTNDTNVHHIPVTCKYHTGKTLDQVTDMMIANAQNLIITVKPTTQPKPIQRLNRPYVSVQLRIKRGADQASGNSFVIINCSPLSDKNKHRPGIVVLFVIYTMVHGQCYPLRSHKVG